MTELRNPWGFGYTVYYGGAAEIILDNTTKETRKILRENPGTIFPVDSDFRKSQKLASDRLYLLTSGEIRVEYKDGSVDTIRSGYYNSDSWVSYQTFWEPDKKAHIIPTSECAFFEFVAWNDVDEESRGHFALFDILVKKLEPGTHVIDHDQSKQVCLFVLRGNDRFKTGGNFQITSGSHTFDSSNPTVSELFTDGTIPLPPSLKSENYKDLDIHQFLLKGNTTIVNDSKMHVLMLTAKTELRTILKEPSAEFLALKASES